MNIEVLPALALFAIVSSVTPGPNNLMLMASGANYGFRRTIPHMLGISIGFMVLMLLTGIGLVRVFEIYPISYVILKILSVAYLLYLAWKIATAAPVKERTATGKPMTFLQAAAFQWVNPKVWAVALSATAYVATLAPVQQAIVLATSFSTINLGVGTFWALAGSLLSYLLTNEAAWRIFMRIMALALVGFSVLLFL